MNDLKITLRPSQSDDFNPYFLPNEQIDSIKNEYSNYYRRSLAIESFKIDQFKTRVKRKQDSLFIKLDDGNWLHVKKNPNYDEGGHTFEYYFKEFGFFSIRVQWTEGNGYKLINSKTGEITNIIGRPFFSPDGTRIIALGNDIEAGYSINGFQFLDNNSGTITEIGIYSPPTWGCESAKWISTTKLILKNESIEFNNSQSNYFNFFTELEIE